MWLKRMKNGLVLQPLPKAHGDIPKREYQSPPPESLSRGRGFRKWVRKEPELGLPGGWHSAPCTQDHGTFAMVLKNMMGRLAWAQWGAGGLAGGGQPRGVCGGDWKSGCGGESAPCACDEGISGKWDSQCLMWGCWARWLWSRLGYFGESHPHHLPPRLYWLKGRDQSMRAHPSLAVGLATQGPGQGRHWGRWSPWSALQEVTVGSAVGTGW